VLSAQGLPAVFARGVERARAETGRTGARLQQAADEVQAALSATQIGDNWGAQKPPHARKVAAISGVLARQAGVQAQRD